MGNLNYFVLFAIISNLLVKSCDSAKINTPRVLLPWFENLFVNFTFEIIEGGCYSWSLSRDDTINLEPLYEDTWGHCSRAARVSVSKTCIPPCSVIILAEEVNTGEILRGDVDIDTIKSLKIVSTTRNLYLEEAPEAFEVIAYDEKGNKFSTLEGISFTWTTENVGYEGNPLVNLVQWQDTDYEAPPGIAELEAQSLHSYSVLLYGQAMGESRVTVCLDETCTESYLHVVASVVLTPAIAFIAPGDTLQYKVVRVRAGRLTITDVASTIYNMEVPHTGVGILEDGISLIRGAQIGSAQIFLMSEATEVAKATLTVVEPFSIQVTVRPSNLIIHGEVFIIHCVVFDEEGHPLTAGPEILIRLAVEGSANVDLIKSTENGTITEAIAQNAGEFTVSAILFSVAGKSLTKKVEGQTSAVSVDPLAMVPPEMFIAWTETMHKTSLRHSGGGDELVTWSEGDDSVFSLTPSGLLIVRGVGQLDVKLYLTKYPHIRASGRVWSAAPELIQVSSSGLARVGRPHHLHITLTATHPATGELYNFDICNCASIAVSSLEGPEPRNVTAAPWIQPAEGACCVLECVFESRGVSSVAVSRGRAADGARVSVRAAPALLWPAAAAALVGASLPVIGEGESLIPQSSEPRIAEFKVRDDVSPHRYPEAQLFTLKCRRKGEAVAELWSSSDDERESVSLEAWCASHVSRARLDPPSAPGNCEGPRIWLRPGQEVPIKVTLFDEIGRELLSEEGPNMFWEVQPNHVGIEYKAMDKLFVEQNTKYAPVPVPDKYFQVVVASEKAIGWSGTLKASIPDTYASIQAKVVAPLKCIPIKVNMAWEGESVPNISVVTGGSGKYSVETPKGVTAAVEEGKLTAVLPAPGTYDLVVTDLCVSGEKRNVEVNIEEVLSVEVSTARAVCVNHCIPIGALVRGVSHGYLTASREPDWKTEGDVLVRDGALCGLREGSGRIRASLAGVWSPPVEVWVFPALRVVPGAAVVAAGGRLRLRHAGGPPPHMAALHYSADGQHALVSSSGLVRGVTPGTTRIKLIATDVGNVELASAEAVIEVVPVTSLRVRAATQTLLVGLPGPVWIEAAGLTAAALSSLQPPPKVTWTLRDPTVARIYTSHIDDRLERSAVEGLSVRVVPLKPGVITLDVRVRNMGQAAETRTWDSTIEILGVSDIRTSIDGFRDLNPGDILSLAVGSTVRLKSLPKGTWSSYQDGSFEVQNNGDIIALRPGNGVIIATHKDERNNIERQAVVQVHVSPPHYCTAEPTDKAEALRLVLRDSLGRELLAPQANVTLVTPFAARIRRNFHSALGNEILLSGLEANGAFMSFQSAIGGVTVADEVWIPGSDAYANRIIATGSWAICLEGVGWMGPPGVSTVPGAGLTLAVLDTDASATHVLRLDRPAATVTVLQLPIYKMEFLPGEWPSSLVPLSIQAEGLTSGPILCSEEQKLALDGIMVNVPFTCRTASPYSAQGVLDIPSGQLGCSVVPGSQITEAVEIELCAEWGVSRTCTKVQLLPPIQVSQTQISLLNPPSIFVIDGHPNALKMVKVIPSPGLKLETNSKEGKIHVTVKSEMSTCGVGWVNVLSKLTSQEIRVEVERECDIACGTLLGAIFSIIKPYLSTLVTVAVIAVGYLYVQHHLQQKAQINLPKAPIQTPLQTPLPEPRTRTWSRSPYASNPSAPVYGDTSMLPDASFSPNSTRIHSRLL